MTERVVVAGAVYDGGRLLAARRSAPAELAGRWELPGGKLEPGERPEDGLVRELREELGVETEVLARIPGSWPLKPGYVLQVWTVRLVSGEPRPLEDHDALRWLGPDETGAVDWLEQDRPAVAEAARLLREHGRTTRTGGPSRTGHASPTDGDGHPGDGPGPSVRRDG
ncbi:(deoxy)nucleoside triphosphate pyrophosphohydrolase [Streptomyces yaizuensis]|uniref:8-oxo-dGTP diphosphatase n=1 Tax=Streptomyces yaizuensis TaxID=2989713 RepID=A0ABQ5NVR3_9ACTN|nr:(deoxy)nucleoside triphosphate pyrophosphohydrolase [Streptomyces sp. YSPA8]GLF94442.1 (deoxy)nucleoside triphosphate pyrophosphohydrolase [Streptomyces sp. YSPA8]